MIKRVLDDISRAFSQLKIKINPGKTEILFMKSKRLNYMFNNITIMNEAISLVNFLNSLEVTLDSSFSLDKHVNLISSSCFNLLRKLYQVQNYLSLSLEFC